MGKRAVAAVAGEMWEPAFGAGFQAPRANQESQVSYSSRPPAACHFHSKAANSAHFLRNRIFGLPDGLKSSFSRKPPKMHPSSDSCAVPKNQCVAYVIGLVYSLGDLAHHFALFLGTNALRCFNKQDWHVMASSSDFYYGSPSSFSAAHERYVNVQYQPGSHPAVRMLRGWRQPCLQDAITL